MVLMESRDSEGVPFASLGSLTRHLADIGPWRVTKSGHVTITKIENLQIEKSLIPKIFFSIYDEKKRKLSRKKTVSEQWCHQVLVNAWIDARRQYILIIELRNYFDCFCIMSFYYNIFVNYESRNISSCSTHCFGKKKGIWSVKTQNWHFPKWWNLKAVQIMYK